MLAAGRLLFNDFEEHEKEEQSFGAGEPQSHTARLVASKAGRDRPCPQAAAAGQPSPPRPVPRPPPAATARLPMGCDFGEPPADYPAVTAKGNGERAPPCLAILPVQHIVPQCEAAQAELR